VSWLVDDPLTRFIAQIVVIVAAARLLGRIARRFGQPAVVAEIIAGIVLGPSVLGWLAPSVSSALFPAESLDLVRAASQLGLVMFVFLVGLELDVKLLRGRVRASLAIALATIAVPFGLGAALACGLGTVAGPGSSLELALFLGVAMSVTAFPVLARMLAEHHLLRTRIGTLAITCAAINDLVAWCLLAFAVSLARAGALADALATTALACAFVVLVLFGVRPLVARLVARVRVPLAVTPDAVALVVVGMLGSAWLTERIGIHFVFGAFVFGAVVPRRDGFARAIAEKLEDIAVVVLLPLFFAISGLRTRIDLVASTDHVLACAAIIAVACVSKIGGTSLAARATGLRWRDAGALGVLMNTRGLMELIVINMGFELGVFSQAMFAMLVVMVLVTTIATSPVLRRIYPAQEAMRDLLATDDARPRPRASYRMLTCIASPPAGPSLVGMANALSGEGAEVIALHLASGDDAGDVLDPALARAGELGLSARPLAFVSDNPAGDIVRVADLRDADLVLLGALGDVAHGVLQHAETTVAVFVDRGLTGAPARVLVPGTDRAALALAERIRRTTGVTIVESAADAEIARSSTSDLVVLGVGREADMPLRDCAASLLVVRGPLAQPGAEN
jgi:Kef-type K+ transport system membrane component KefB